MHSNINTVLTSDISINSNITKIETNTNNVLVMNDNNIVNFDNTYSNIEIGLYQNNKFYYNSNIAVNGEINFNISCNIEKTNIIAEYIFNDTSNIGKDLKNNYNLIQQNGNLELYENKYLHFNKTISYLENSLIDLSLQEFSISFWIKINNFENYRDLNIITFDNRFKIGIKYNLSKLQYYISFQNNNELVSFPYYANDIKNWIFLTFVVERNNSRKIYRNGELICYDVNNEYLLTNNSNLQIGNQNDNNEHDYLISTLNVYNNALFNEEIITLYNTNKLELDNLRLDYDYKFNDNTKIEDISKLNTVFVHNEKLFELKTQSIITVDNKYNLDYNNFINSNNNIYTFKYNANNTNSSGQTEYAIEFKESTNCDILVIGGGGAGGSLDGGGGGAGTVIYHKNQNISGNYKLKIGRGGIGNFNAMGENGKDTTLLNNEDVVYYNAVGGGGGSGSFGYIRKGGSSGGLSSYLNNMFIM